MIVTILESILIFILSTVAIVGLTLLGRGLRKLRLNSVLAMQDRDYSLHEMEPQKIHQLFEYKTK